MDVKKLALVMIHTPCLCGSESDREDLFVYVCVRERERGRGREKTVFV